MFYSVQQPLEYVGRSVLRYQSCTPYRLQLFEINYSFKI